MILFFQGEDHKIIATEVTSELSNEAISRLTWLYSGANKVEG